MVSLRTLLFAGLLLAMGCSSDEVAVDAPAGRVVGVVEQDAEAFLGVPYAVPPIGARRWTLAELAPDSAEPIAATAHGPACWQVGGGGEGGQSEDCLTLNIWRSRRAAGGSLPVIVYLHGGSFERGSGQIPPRMGEAFASRGVILVTLNYRLGPFGRLRADGVGADPNFALSDQRAALRWVARNIESFGGDPRNVTLVGSSAGGMATLLHARSEEAGELFRRIIVQSGGLAPLTVPREAASAEARALARRLGVAPNAPAMRGLSPAQLLEASRPSVLQGRPVDDSRYDGPVRVPMMIGVVSDEGTLLPSATEADWALIRSRIAQEGIDSALPLRERFSQALFLRPTARLAQESAEASYLWYYDYQPSWRAPAPGARHGQDSPFSLLVPEAVPLKTRLTYQRADRRMAEAMLSAWTTFAATGVPSVPGAVGWPEAGPELQAMWFTSEGTLQIAPLPVAGATDRSAQP